MAKAKQMKDKDLYKLIGVLSDADENAIKKAYRKKALSCHPDKNPDNPEAAAKFHELSEALEVLTDPEARKAYDNLQKAKRANEVRNNLLDAKRKKMKDDLEAREKAAQSCTKDDPILGMFPWFYSSLKKGYRWYRWGRGEFSLLKNEYFFLVPWLLVCQFIEISNQM